MYAFSLELLYHFFSLPEKDSFECPMHASGCIKNGFFPTKMLSTILRVLYEAGQAFKWKSIRKNSLFCSSHTKDFHTI